MEHSQDMTESSKNDLSSKYFSNTAYRYDKRRENTDKWKKENQIIDQYIRHFSQKTRVLDSPIGTGRFMPLYKKYKFSVTGLDISQDMIDIARAKADKAGLEIEFKNTSLFETDIEDNAYDVVLCIRFLNWVDKKNALLIAQELARLSSRNIIFSLRTRVPISQLLVQGFNGILIILRQAFRHFIKTPNDKGLVFHSHDLICEICKKNSLAIEQSEQVEMRKDGTAYVIYNLKKADV